MILSPARRVAPTLFALAMALLLCGLWMLAESGAPAVSDSPTSAPASTPQASSPPAALADVRAPRNAADEDFGSPAPTALPEAPPEPGILSGVVVDELGSPLDGVSVEILRTSWEVQIPASSVEILHGFSAPSTQTQQFMADASLEWRADVVTDSSGAFQFAPPEKSGEFQVTAWRRIGELVQTSQKPHVSVPKAGLRLVLRSFDLQRAARLQAVDAQSGALIPGFSVRCFSQRTTPYKKIRSGAQWLREQTTSVTLLSDQLLPGEHVLRIDATGYEPNDREIEPGDLVAGSSKVISVPLHPLRDVGGTVRDEATGGPVAGAQIVVEAMDTLGPFPSSMRGGVSGPVLLKADLGHWANTQVITKNVAVSDASGRFALLRAAASLSRLHISAPGYAEHFSLLRALPEQARPDQLSIGLRRKPPEPEESKK
ncbi:MAG: hypothetical protein JNJ88_20100 [Planctomycetes bacterium]|nr:hypothetical protein [Planctomycetota bacterium]